MVVKLTVTSMREPHVLGCPATLVAKLVLGPAVDPGKDCYLATVLHSQEESIDTSVILEASCGIVQGSCSAPVSLPFAGPQSSSTEQLFSCYLPYA